jgi:hypothetical protein
MPVTANMVVGPKEYQSSDWGKTLSISDVWEGPMADLIAHRDSIKTSYTRTSITPTKGDHGKLVATLETNSDGGSPTAPAGDTNIEVEWMELRLPVETHEHFDSLTAEQKAQVRKAAETGSPLSPMGAVADELYDLIAGGTSSYSTGVPVVRKTTKNASNIAKGSAWFRDTPPVTIPGGWVFLKTADRRIRVGADIQKVEEWTGGKAVSDILYPTS